MDTIVDRSAVSCMLDRLTLLSSGSDQKVAEIFARAEVKRKFCGQRDPLMYATPKRPGSAETAASLKLRGTLASRDGIETDGQEAARCVRRAARRHRCRRPSTRVRAVTAPDVVAEAGRRPRRYIRDR